MTESPTLQLNFSLQFPAVPRLLNAYLAKDAQGLKSNAAAQILDPIRTALSTEVYAQHF